MRSACLLLTVLTACFSQVPEPRLVERERADLVKLAEFAKQRQATIFFDGISGLGYVRDGEVNYFGNAHAVAIHLCNRVAVSHRGDKVAFSLPTKDWTRCKTVNRTLATGEEKVLTEAEFAPWVWSWDDSAIMGLQTGKLHAATLLSASDGAVMATYRVQRYSPNPAWMASADFPHHSSGILASTYTCVPRNRREWCATEHSLMLINQETQKLLAEGRGATISPTGHSVAAFTKHAVTIYDLATLKRTDVSRYPHPPLFHYAAEDPVGQIVWSTDAKQLIFRTAIDESGHQNVYVVDLSSRRRTKLLNKTSLEIVAWR